MILFDDTHLGEDEYPEGEEADDADQQHPVEARPRLTLRLLLNSQSILGSFKESNQQGGGKLLHF